MIVWYSAYGLVVFDLFIVALLQLLDTHYEIISSAFENFKYKAENVNDYEESVNEEVFDLSPFAERPIEVQLQEDEESEEEQINIAEEELFKDYY
ncbi:hypothetical protein ACI65C_000540 [Semiaphis heraclei]